MRGGRNDGGTLYQKPGCKAGEKMKGWLTEHQIDSLERNIMTDSWDGKLVLKLSRRLPGGLMGYLSIRSGISVEGRLTWLWRIGRIGRSPPNSIKIHGSFFGRS